MVQICRLENIEHKRYKLVRNNIVLFFKGKSTGMFERNFKDIKDYIAGCF